MGYMLDLCTKLYDHEFHDHGIKIEFAWPYFQPSLNSFKPNLIFFFKLTYMYIPISFRVGLEVYKTAKLNVIVLLSLIEAFIVSLSLLIKRKLWQRLQ